MVSSFLFTKGIMAERPGQLLKLYNLQRGLCFCVLLGNIQHEIIARTVDIIPHSVGIKHAM